MNPQTEERGTKGISIEVMQKMQYITSQVSYIEDRSYKSLITLHPNLLSITLENLNHFHRFKLLLEHQISIYIKCRSHQFEATSDKSLFPPRAV